MSNRKRGLTREQIEELLAESSDSDFSNSEFDDSDNQTDSDSECSNSSEGSIQRQTSRSSVTWSSVSSSSELTEADRKALSKLSAPKRRKTSANAKMSSLLCVNRSRRKEGSQGNALLLQGMRCSTVPSALF